jgi:hypothetical protein
MATTTSPEKNKEQINHFLREVDDLVKGGRPLQLFASLSLKPKTDTDAEKLKYLNIVTKRIEGDYGIISSLSKNSLHVTIKAPLKLSPKQFSVYMQSLVREIHAQRLFDVIMNRTCMFGRNALGMFIRGDIGTTEDLVHTMRSRVIDKLRDVYGASGIIPQESLSDYEYPLMRGGVITSDPHATLFSFKKEFDRFWALAEELEKAFSGDKISYGKINLEVDGLIIFVRPVKLAGEEQEKYSELSLPFHLVSIGEQGIPSVD